ncbi:MAG: TetM/TetW/TetO/TetS family tetracycline resistance ribosomal protection protein [Lachnospiraceae bacterium]|nr:TetM/TetW/TetO/TetS family tetracycline resistance ribosomal protection protein [Lachnospiraceae bacterium]
MRTDGEQQHAHSPGAAGTSSHLTAGTEENRKKRTCCTGLLAHVDAGKTTLAEGILYLTGRIRSLGRVDHKDAFFDNFELERARGITIFSKQTQVELPELTMTLLDTPGHVDFSAEMERTLQVLDYAVLVISGADGVQSHVETLWRLLTRYEIPVFLFVNKMDQPGTDREALLAELKSRLDERCVDFTGAEGMKRMGLGGETVNAGDDSGAKAVNAGDGSGAICYTDTEEFQENLAMCDDELLELYAAGERIGTERIRRMVAERRIFPCFFGSALRLKGVEELLEGIQTYSMSREYAAAFGARVYKITRDAQGNRLTHMKITGGTLRVKNVLTNQEMPTPGEPSVAGNMSVSGDEYAGEQPLPSKGMEKKAAPGGEIWTEKVNQIRILSGENYETVSEASAGMLCAVTGLEHTYAGEGLGVEPEAELPVLEPVLSYRIALPEGTDVHRVFRQLKQLEEEEPELHITWAAGVSYRSHTAVENRLATDGAAGETDTGEIHAQLMGEVQTEILQNVIRERFGLAVTFGEGSIVYRETIAEPVVGMGHFEPLRHYAEVHLLLEPAERGSGLQFASTCSVDELALNWQRLILTHLEEKSHLGVLTGSEITDMKITLVAGRAHQKHTEGGDFRQATYRAVRQGLCRAQSILLEPVYRFRLEIPMETVGRALSDIQRMYGNADASVLMEAAGTMEKASDMAVITGTAPVVTMRGYQSEVLAYTKGRGRLFCSLKGYEECHNAQEVIEARAYDAQADLENPCGSVFCAHGAGFVVNWEDVPNYIHIQGTDVFAEAALARAQGGDVMHSGVAIFSSAENKGGTLSETTGSENTAAERTARENRAALSGAEDDELRAIFERTYGTSDRERKRFSYGKNGRSRQDSGWAGYESTALREAHRNGRSDLPPTEARGRFPSLQTTRRKKANQEELEECLLVDGYNIIFAWDELKELAKISLESARGRLLDLMCNYQGYKNNRLIVVFDAYRVANHNTEVLKYHNIYVVYTKEAETADQYIEKTVRTIDRKYHVTVATSDALEQVIIFGAGASRLSSKGLLEELRLMQKDLHENYLNAPQKGGKAYLLEGQDEILGQIEET